MGNCIDNNNQTVIQDDGSKPIPNQGQYGFNSQMNNYGDDEYSGGNYKNRKNNSVYRQQDHTNYQNGKQNQPNYLSNSKKNIDFDRIGSNFVFFQDAKKYFDDSPWQRDESDNTNRPSTLVFSQNQKQPLPNGLATKSQQQNTNQSMYGISNMNLNQSMNRSIDKGYSSQILNSNRKKQNIFYDSSTYNQNPYVKSTIEQPSQRIQSSQLPHLSYSAITYH